MAAADGGIKGVIAHGQRQGERERAREMKGVRESKLKCKQFFNYAIHLKGFATKTWAVNKWILCWICALNRSFLQLQLIFNCTPCGEVCNSFGLLNCVQFKRSRNILTYFNCKSINYFTFGLFIIATKLNFIFAYKGRL